MPKACADYSRFRKEALILKDIRHPGIPIVYDLEEDDRYSYLIEEYLEGDSLYALISDVGHFSKAMTIRYGIQICRLVNILHSARPNPILYLDLQPKNLLLCHDVVKLIDFDHAVYLREADSLMLRYGTVGCAAPEQYTGEVLDERTDIYAIGAVLHYMLTGAYPPSCRDAGTGALFAGGFWPLDGTGRALERIIRRCLRTDRGRRYQSAEALCAELETLAARIQGQESWKGQEVSGKDGISSLTIAVAGCQPGAGATHTAVGLTAYLRRNGIFAVYREENDSGAVRLLARWAGAAEDSCGIVTVRGVPMRPRYGDCVRLKEPEYPVTVVDLGTDWREFENMAADLYLVVCGARPWEGEAARTALAGLSGCGGLSVIWNRFCRKLSCRLPREAGAHRNFLMPEYEDPFTGTGRMDRVCSAVLKGWPGEGTGGILRKLHGKLRGKGKTVFQRSIQGKHGKPLESSEPDGGRE